MDTAAPAAPAAPSPATAAPDANAAPSSLEAQIATAGGDGLTSQQHRDAVLFGLERGIITRDKANAELRLAGAAPLADDEGVTAPKPGAANADTVAVDTLPGFEPGKVADFKLPDVSALNQIVETDKFGAPGRGLTPAETMEIQQTVGTWMADARLPASVGSAIAGLAGQHLKEMPQYERMDENAQQTYRLVEAGKLQKLWGGKAQENVDLARGLVRDLATKNPTLIPFLERTGLGNNSGVIAQLAQQARRLKAQKG